VASPQKKRRENSRRTKKGPLKGELDNLFPAEKGHFLLERKKKKGPAAKRRVSSGKSFRQGKKNRTTAPLLSSGGKRRFSFPMGEGKKGRG